MPHQHAQAHVVRRQRFHQDDEDTTIDDVQPDIDDGPRTMVPPAVRPRPHTHDDDDFTQPPSTTQPVSTSKPRKPSSTPHSSYPTATARPTIKEASTLMIATQEPRPTATATATAGVASATAPAAPDAAEGGMSGGAKIGLGLGVLFVFCALLTAILLVYRRKKKQMAAAQPGNEKIDLHNAAPPPPPCIHVAAASPPSTHSNRTSTAPRLELRPVTQFDPTFNVQRKSGAKLLKVAAAGGAEARAPSTNPFNDPQARSRPPANPFGNSAAVNAQHAGIPDSPPSNSPLHSTQPGKDFANPGPATAAAGLSAVLASSQPNDLPVPPPKSANGSIEAFPASPGPAPTGSLPVAGALAGSRPQSPGPGPDNVHRVQLDFESSMQDELDLHAGQLVRMLHEYDDGWALCIRMDRSQQGVVPRSCLSKHSVKPRIGPPRQGPPPPGIRGPPIPSPMGPGGIPQPRPLSPGTTGPISPAPRPLQNQSQNQSPPQPTPRPRSNSNTPASTPKFSQPLQRSHSNGDTVSPTQPPPPPQQTDTRPSGLSASQVGVGISGDARMGPGAAMNPMNPDEAGNVSVGAGVAQPPAQQVVHRKPVPGLAI